MTIYECKQRDLISVTLTVLVLVHDVYATNIFKFIIQDDYPDLKGLIATDYVDDPAFEMITGNRMNHRHPRDTILVIHFNCE